MPKGLGSKPRKQQKHQGPLAQKGGSSRAAAAAGSTAAQTDELETLCTPLQRPASQKLRTATHCEVGSHQLLVLLAWSRPTCLLPSYVIAEIIQNYILQ